MNEDNMLKKIKKSAEHVPTPQKLEPGHMREYLKEAEPRRVNELRQKYRTGVKFAAAAAAFVIAVFGWKYLENIESSASLQTKLAAEQPGAMSYTENTPEKQSGRGADKEAGNAMTEQVAEEADIQLSLETGVEGEVKYAAESYDEIYDQIEALARSQEQELCGAGITGVEDSQNWKSEAFQNNQADEAPMMKELQNASQVMEEPAAAAPAEEFSALSKEAAGVYSETNIQVAGVDEGDIVKTDGKYIYSAYLDAGEIRIIRADGSKLKLEATISWKEDGGNVSQLKEFYIDGSNLSVVRDNYNESEAYGVDESFYRRYTGSQTILETYDISNRKKPKKTGSMIQDGSYRDSRKIDDFIYLLTNYTADLNAEREEKEKYIPQAGGAFIPCDSIFYPKDTKQCQYLVISSVDIKKPGQTADSAAFMTDPDLFYISTANLYAGTTKYDYKAAQYDYTELMKFSLESGQITFQAHGLIDGYLKDQFSMDEYNGKLRVVSTMSNQYGMSLNVLSVLDEKLDTIGRIDDLAPGEEIYSARFMGDTGYFVTYRNIDPLFSADLSDPENPRILGKLKIPGFSEYLHFYGDGLLFGIGRETDPITGNFIGLKLSMFDISNPEAVTEKNKLVEREYEDSDAWNNHKAVLISPEKNLIGFSVEALDKKTRTWQRKYVLYTYNETDGFVKVMETELEDYSYETRGLFIGSWFYVAEPQCITSFSLTDYSKRSKLELWY